MGGAGGPFSRIEDWIGLYGALMATGVAIWDLYKYRHEQPRLNVRCSVAELTVRFFPIEGETAGVETEGEGLPTGQPHFLAYRVTNVGGRPIIVADVGGTYHGGTKFRVRYPPVELPKRLEAGEFLELATDLRIVGKNLASLAAWDSVGKAWKVSWLELRRLKKAVEAVR